MSDPNMAPTEILASLLDTSSAEKLIKDAQADIDADMEWLDEILTECCNQFQ